MIEPVGPLVQAPCEEVKLGRMQITGGWIHAQSVPISGGRNALGRADRSGIEQQLRKEGRTVAAGVVPETPLSTASAGTSGAGGSAGRSNTGTPS